MSTSILTARPVSRECLTPKQYINLTKHQRGLIKSVELVAPRLGEKGFGAIAVRYKKPVYAV